MPALDDRPLPVFACQHWLVGIDDIDRAGGTGAMATARVRSGRWVRADVNVFRLAGIRPSWESRLLFGGRSACVGYVSPGDEHNTGCIG